MDRQLQGEIEQLILNVISTDLKILVRNTILETQEEWRKGVENCVQAVGMKVEAWDDCRNVKELIKNNETLGEAIDAIVRSKYTPYQDQLQRIREEIGIFMRQYQEMIGKLENMKSIHDDLAKKVGNL